MSWTRARHQSSISRQSLNFVAIALAAAALSACAYLPKDGPTRLEVRGNADVRLEDEARLSYAFVQLSSGNISAFETEPQPRIAFSRLASLRKKADVRIIASDTISIAIFEAGAGGLFVPAEAGARPGNFIQIPTQEVGRDGTVTIPYGGAVRVLGRTPREVETDIVQKLRSRAIEPQAIVTVSDRTLNGVTILGDVRTPTLLPLRPGGIRLLAALARAGGSSAADYSTVVTLQRGGQKEQALLTSIVQDQRQNIELAPDDIIYVTAESRIFMAFGAVGRGNNSINIGLGGGATTPGQRYVIDRSNMSLTEALANAGGVASGAADPRAVFLFRYTPKATLAAAGVDVSGYPTPQVPTVFSIDLSQAEGYFLANHFLIKHNDIIYVSESPSVDLAKFLGIVNGLTSTSSGLFGAIVGARGL